jgi:hypothetical protein
MKPIYYDLDPSGSWDISTPEGLARSKEWLDRHLTKIRDGGIWLVPRSGSVIRVYHSERKAVLGVQLLPDPALRKVFEALGWTWVDEEGER